MQDKHLEPDCEEDIESLTDDEEEDAMLDRYIDYLEELKGEIK